MELIISGNKENFKEIMNRLIKKYGKEATLELVIKSEMEKYGLKRGLYLN